MRSLLDGIIDDMGSKPRVVSENHDTGSINWVAGMSDPGEMIGCGMYQELRRANGEKDDAYQKRLIGLLAKLPAHVREKIEATGRAAAMRRASLDTSKGRVNVMSAGKLPWHGLGVVVDKATTSAEAIRFAGLDWTVTKEQLFYTGPDGTKRTADDAFAIVRQDTGACLGNVGSRYKPIQNAQGFDFLDTVLNEFGAKYETAGSLYNGSSVWMLAHLPQQAFTINGGDDIEPYVIFTNCHDGSGAAACYPTSVRVVCANTFRTSHGDKHKGLSIRHTGDVKDKIKAAQSALGMAVESFTEFKENAETLYHKPLEIVHYAHDVLDACLEVSQAQANMGANVLAATIAKTQASRELLAKTLEKQIDRRKEILDDILHRYESERCGIGSIRGTAWAAFNAVTEHADHAKVGRQAQDPMTRMSRRFESTIAGDADSMKQTAFEIAMKA